MRQLTLEDRDLPFSQNNYQEIGKIFRQARQERCIDIHEVAQSLYIRQIYLEAIEQGDFDVLPGRVYALGFIKKYAEFLNLDYEELKRRLNLDGDDYTTIVVEDIMQPHKMGNYKKPILLSLALVAGGAYTYFYLNHSAEPAVALIQEPPAFIEPAANNESQQIQPEVIVETPTLPEASIQEPIVKSPSLVLYAKASTWIELRNAIGQVIFCRVLKKGESYTLPPQKGLVMSVGNAGGLEIKKDDVLLPSLGGHGHVRKGLSVDQLFS